MEQESKQATLLDITQSGVNIKESSINKTEISTSMLPNNVDNEDSMPIEYWIGSLILIVLMVSLVTIPYIKEIFFDKNKNDIDTNLSNEQEVEKQEKSNKNFLVNRDDLFHYEHRQPTVDSKSDKNTKEEGSFNGNKSDSNLLNKEEKGWIDSLKSQFEEQTYHLLALDKELKEVNSKLEFFADFVMKKEEIIKRYEDGYDQKIAKNFRNEIFDLIHFIKKENKKENKNGNSSLTIILDDLESILSNLSIEELDIFENKDYDTKQVIIVKRVSKDNPTYHNKVADVLKSGYFSFITENQIKILRRAEIAIYVNQNKGIKNG